MAVLYEIGGTGGHEMIPYENSSHEVVDIDTMAALTQSDAPYEYVVNAYTVQRWANCDVISLTAHINQGDDTIGKWEDNPTWKNYDPATDNPRTYREGWLYSTDLYDVLNDDSIEITPIFDMADSEVVSLYAMRIDDKVYLPITTPGGSDNPKEKGWFEKSGSTFVLSTDTTVASGKTYYSGVGAVAFKLNSAIYTSTGVDIGLNLKHQRINNKNFDVM